MYLYRVLFITINKYGIDCQEKVDMQTQIESGN
jgi:hypothetical protein